MARVAGAVLAAGSGTRMGRPKAEIVVDGERLLDRAVAALAGGGAAPVYAVVRAGVVVAGAERVINPAPERGMRSSLALAVGAASQAERDALALVLVDAPGITPDAVRAVIDAWRPHRIARARYGPAPGHPIVMDLDHWRAALGAAGSDGGARDYLAAHRDLIDDVELAGNPGDLDTADDLAAWRRATGEE